MFYVVLKYVYYLYVLKSLRDETPLVFGIPGQEGGGPGVLRLGLRLDRGHGGAGG